MRPNLTAPDTPGSDKREITAETVGTKRYLHVKTFDEASGSQWQFMDMVRLALQGGQPEPHFDSVQEIEIDTDNVQYRFTCNGVEMFTIDVTNASTQPVVTVNKSVDITDEGGVDALLAENDDVLIQE